MARRSLLVLYFITLGVVQTHLSMDHILAGDPIKGSGFWERVGYSFNDTDLYISYYSIVDVIGDYLLISFILLWLLIFMKRVLTLLLTFTMIVMALWFFENVSIYYDRVAAWSTYSTRELFHAVLPLSTFGIMSMLAIYLCLAIVTLRGYRYSIRDFAEIKSSSGKLFRKYGWGFFPATLIFLWIIFSLIGVINGYLLVVGGIALLLIIPFLAKKYEVRINRYFSAHRDVFSKDL